MKKQLLAFMCIFLLSLSACNQGGYELTVPAEKRNRMMWEEQMVAGKAEGYYQMGVHYIKGLDGIKDDTKGTHFLCKAALKNYTPAMIALGDFYQNLGQAYGIQPSADKLDHTPSYDALAYAWYEIAARNNDISGKKKALELFELFPLETSQMAKHLADAFPYTLCVYYPDRVEALN